MARPQIWIAGRSYDLQNYLAGGAMGVSSEAQRAVTLMNDCVRFLRDDDGYGLGDTPKHAVAALERALAEARRLEKDTQKVRAHLYRNAAKTNPPKHGVLRCAGCRVRPGFIRIGGRDYCVTCSKKLTPKRRR